MSDSAFLTTDLSQNTTELIIPLLFSFLLVELKLILMGVMAKVMHSKSQSTSTFCTGYQRNSTCICLLQQHKYSSKTLCPFKRQIRSIFNPLSSTKLYIRRETCKVQNPHKTAPTVHRGGAHPAALLETSRRTGTFSGDILATQPGSYGDSFPVWPRAAPRPKRHISSRDKQPAQGLWGGHDGMKIILFLKPLPQTVVPGEPRPHSFEVFHTHLAAPAVSHINCSFTAKIGRAHV